MTRKVYVTPAQRAAARFVMERDAAEGRTSSPEIVLIASASRPRVVAEARPPSGAAAAAK